MTGWQKASYPLVGAVVLMALVPGFIAAGEARLELTVVVRGGAFDTYFDNQATCQFQSGDTPVARKRNLGFRCAVGICDLMLTSVEEASA